MSPQPKDVSDSVTSSQSPQSHAPATQALHADRHLDATSDVAPPLHVSTNFRYDSDPDALIPAAEIDVNKPPPLYFSLYILAIKPLSQT